MKSKFLICSYIGVLFFFFSDISLGAILQGKIEDAETSQGIPDLTINILSKSSYITTKTNQEGFYIFSDISEGGYKFEIKRNLSLIYSANIRVKEKTEIKNVKLKRVTISTQWQTIMSVSWVKPNDIIGRRYYLKVDEGIYIWPIGIIESPSGVEIVINSTPKGPEEINNAVEHFRGTLNQNKKSASFLYAGYEYRINFIKVGRAGWSSNPAAFFYSRKESAIMRHMSEASIKGISNNKP